MNRRQTPREVFQRELERALAGDAEAAAQVRSDWEPQRKFYQEGPDVGREEEYDRDDEIGRWKVATESRPSKHRKRFY